MQGTVLYTHIYIYMCVCVSHSVVSNSLQPHGLCSPTGSSVHTILQARILEWVAIFSSNINTHTHTHTSNPQAKYYFHITDGKTEAQRY